jgi:hypothetical protein
MITFRRSRLLAFSLFFSLTARAWHACAGNDPTPAAGTVPPLKDKEEAKPKKAALTVEGTFTGIEQGDYAHWNMRTKAGEVSYYILKPDASVEKVLKNAKPFVGRKCRITYKKTTENIPEAGGKMEVEQIVSVEWLGKK